MITQYSVFRMLSRTLIVFAPLVFSGFAAASDAPQDLPQKESRIVVGGKARIYGDWDCEGSARVAVTPGEAREPLLGFPGGIQVVRVAVPVASFECSDSLVGNSFRDALQEKDHPEIHFDMYSYKFEDEEGAAKVTGDFTIAGVTRNVELDAKLTPLEQNGVNISGSIEILMTDFGIKPPEMLLGLIKVNDNVSVTFDLVILPPEDMPEEPLQEPVSPEQVNRSGFPVSR